MKNIDGKGHSILYPASLSGKPEVLNFIMEQDWWSLEILKQEETLTEWESFVCNVCAAGCTKLAKIILEKERRQEREEEKKREEARLFKEKKTNIFALALMR